MDTTTMNQQRSPFLRLPGDLRNAVYAYIFGINDIVVVRRHLLSIHPHQLTIGQCIHVLGICRQIRAEATSLLWSKSRISVDEVADLKKLTTLSVHEAIVHIIIPWRTAWTLVLTNNRSSGLADLGSQRNAIFPSFKGLRKVSITPQYHEVDSRDVFFLAKREPFNDHELEVVWWEESIH